VQLLDHVSITVRDIESASRVCKAALGAGIAWERADAIGFGARSRTGDDAHTCVTVPASPAADTGPRHRVGFGHRSGPP